MKANGTVRFPSEECALMAAGDLAERDNVAVWIGYNETAPAEYTDYLREVLPNRKVWYTVHSSEPENITQVADGVSFIRFSWREVH